MKRSLLSMPLIGLALLALTSQSSAVDYKNLPGAACQPEVGAQAVDLERQPFSIKNGSRDQTRRVICPIVRDSIVVTDLDMGVMVTTGTKCLLHGMNRFGEELFAWSPTSIEGVSVDREAQYFVVPGDPEGWNGYYAISCVLPFLDVDKRIPAGEVFFYTSGEFTDTTDNE